MKKTLHGKRYLRSRPNVIIGRNNRRIRKINRMIMALSHIDWDNISKGIVKCFEDMVYHVNKMKESICKVAT